MHLPTKTSLQGGKYKIIDKIGQGGFGIAYKARHELLNKVVCVKEFYYRDLCERVSNSLNITVVSTSSEKIKMVSSFKKKFVKEAQRLAAFQHPNIVQVTDVFEENDTAYFVMEYLEGGSLEDKLKDGVLSEEQTLGIVSPLLDALETVHKEKLLHLDIKPQNIMFRKNGAPVLIDFGISKYMALTEGYTTTSPVGVSKGYAPLEQYGGDIADFTEATDIYSVCASMYFMVTGNQPPEPLQMMSNGLKPASFYQPAISKRFDSSILKGLSLNKNDRHATVSDFIMDLNNSEGSLKANLINSSFQSSNATSIPNKLNGNLYKYSNISASYYGRTKVLLKDKYGYIGKWGEEVIPCIYEDAEDFSEGMARVKLNNKWGFIDIEGNEKTPFIYEYIEHFSEGMAGVQLNGKWGFVNKEGKEVSSFYYEHVFRFSEGLARVKLYDKYGFINKEGYEVMECKYRDAYDFSEGVAWVDDGGVFRLRNKNGEEVRLPLNRGYNKVGSFSEGLAYVAAYKDTFMDTLSGDYNMYYGYIDHEGRQVIPFKYDKVESFDGERAAVMMKKGLFNKKEKWGVIDKSGNEVFPITFDSDDELGKYIEASIYSAQVRNAKLTFFDKNGNVLFVDEEWVSDFEENSSEGLMVSKDISKFWQDNNEKEGYIDIKGRIIIPCIFDEAWDFIDGVALVKLKGEFCVINRRGDIII